jgi:hypothetical protein
MFWQQVKLMQEITNLKKFVTINGTCRDMVVTEHTYLRTSVTADSLDDMPTFSNNASDLV